MNVKWGQISSHKVSWDFAIFVCVFVCWQHRLSFSGEVSFKFTVFVFTDLQYLVFGHICTTCFWNCNKCTVSSACAHTLSPCIYTCTGKLYWCFRDVGLHVYRFSLKTEGLCLLQVSRCWVFRQHTAEQLTLSSLTATSVHALLTNVDVKLHPAAWRLIRGSTEEKKKMEANPHTLPHGSCRCLSVEATKWDECL